MSPPISQSDNSQFLLASFGEHASPGDLGAESHLSDVLFQESDICLDSNLPKEYPGNEPNDITESIECMQTDDDIVSADTDGIDRDIDSAAVYEMDSRDTIEDTGNR